MTAPAMVALRNVVIGRNSRLWAMLQADQRLAAGPFIAIGHADVGDFAFLPGDRLWIFSYSRDMADNAALFTALAAQVDVDVVYVSTATANVDEVTACYAYPRVKRACETLARETLDARIVAIGVVHSIQSDLPAGTTIATSISELADFMLDPVFPAARGELIRLFTPVERPFSGHLEALAFRLYGALQRLVGRFPCLLRPLDLALRALGWRWYGYLYLSNRIWLTTTS